MKGEPLPGADDQTAALGETAEHDLHEVGKDPDGGIVPALYAAVVRSLLLIAATG